MQTAAVGASRGFGDFLDLLALHPRDFQTVRAGLIALTRAEKAAAKRAKRKR